jgi:hypothetical protein
VDEVLRVHVGQAERDLPQVEPRRRLGAAALRQHLGEEVAAARALHDDDPGGLRGLASRLGREPRKLDLFLLEDIEELDDVLALRYVQQVTLVLSRENYL